ncbi:MAG: MltA domain-containing protein [Planctomycetes bacterium]|nr:MltA domain-containing protein [Planctomycetota bacterium]
MLRPLACVLAAAIAIVPAAGCKSRAKPVTQTPPEYTKPLPDGAQALVEVDAATLPPFRLTPAERTALQQAIKHSQAFLAKPSAGAKFPKELPITREMVQASLADLAKLLATASDDELDHAIRSRYRAFMSVGWNGAGSVLFTGYYTPIFSASYTKEGPYRYPIYKRPAQLVGGSVDQQAQWKRADGTLMPCPEAAELESSGMLAGNELAYLADPFEAYVVRIQGSAKLRLPDGKVIDAGYAGTSGHEYRSIGAALAADGRIAKDKLNFFSMRAFFQEHPQELAGYAARNPRYTFFTTTSGGPFGSLGQPVTSDVTVATNKQIFPPAAAMLVQTTVQDGQGRAKPYVSLRMDQDTGGAMRAPGRADLYMGVGDESERRAGVQEYEGRMWYLVLK